MKKPLVSIIILTYSNQWNNVKKCLQSFKQVKFISYEIILVDNASIDDTVANVKKYYPKVVLIENKKNMGFCEGNNIGLRKSNGEFILFLNNDTEVTPTILEPLVEILQKDSSVGVVQPKMRQLIEKDKLDACASFLTNSGFLYHYGYSQKENNKKYNQKLFMYSAKGACFLTRKSLIKKIGLFDPDYFAYFEETDFCHRVWLSGFTVVYEPRSEMFHLGGGDKKNDHPARLQVDSYKNRIQTYLKNLGTVELIKIIPLHILSCLAAAIIYLFIGKIAISKGILKAIWWNISNFANISKKRKFVQFSLRRIPDSSFIKKIKYNPPFAYYKHFLLDPRGKYKDIKL
ncbi:glycosyltransferase family 2 protein [Candidatus Roizmanbacteria bacterium]|nr:glycosyltransferase family 2 protein [Candidatus Roizmanbacteria bacterium]